MVQKHTIWPISMPHGDVMYPYIPHETYQMLYHVIYVSIYGIKKEYLKVDQVHILLYDDCPTESWVIAH